MSVQLGVERANAVCEGTFAELIGMEFTELSDGRAVSKLTVRPELLAPNGYLHGSTVTGIAETTCGFGTAQTLPGNDRNLFATIDLTCSFLGTARDGRITCVATLAHGGRTTQVWDAVVANDSGATLALFRCTQLLLKRP